MSLGPLTDVSPPDAGAAVVELPPSNPGATLSAVGSPTSRTAGTQPKPPLAAAGVMPPDAGATATDDSPFEADKLVPSHPTTVGGIIATELTAVARAGTELARFVLIIVSLSIGTLLVYLFWVDSTIGGNVHDEYRAVSYQAHFHDMDLTRLERLASDLASAILDVHYDMDAAGKQNASALLKSVAELSDLTKAQHDTLNACVPLPTDDLRSDKVRACLAMIDDVRELLINAGAARAARLADDALDRMASHRKAAHDFWLQAAQLVLLNLLLPLLTALFGYIFGQQTADRKGV